MKISTLALCLGAALAPGVALAQCPDGTPPPCRSARAAAAPPANSVAVLYFEAGSRDSNDLYLADGVTEEIINRLSGIERLTVRSRYLVRRYRGTALEDPAAIGRALNVTYLVSGSVRRAGGRLRLSAELIRATGGVQVWGQTFDQAGSDVFTIQEAVARQVATGIVGRLLPAERQTLAARPTTSSVAYEAFLRGNFHIARRDSAGARRAIAEFETALREDPSYTDALARVALAYGLAGANGLSVGLPSDTVMARAVRNADEAVRRAPNASDSWLAVALARLSASPRTLTGVLDALERAIALDPTSAEAHHQMGFSLYVLGQDSLSAVHDHLALAIEPARPVTIMHFAMRAGKHGRYDEARHWVDSALSTDREFWLARATLPWLMLIAGDTAGARGEAATWSGLPPLRGLRPLAMQSLAAHAADSSSVNQWRASVRALIPAEIPVSSGLGMSALLAATTGDVETVMPALEAVRPHGAFLHSHMTWVAFDPIRNDPRFQRLFRETTP